jgi:hypothetical protein
MTFKAISLIAYLRRSKLCDDIDEHEDNGVTITISVLQSAFDLAMPVFVQ